MFAWIEGAFDLIINYSIILLEFIGSAIIVVTAVKALINLLRAAMTFLIHWEIKNEKAETQEVK